MNEHELDLTLDAIVLSRTQVTAPPILREHVHAVPFQTPEERPWLPRLDLGGFHMSSALKFIAAGVIVALFGGFLLAGILATQQDGEVLPGAATASPATVTESPSPMTTEEFLSGMVTEEVEPGVYRVVNDGVRDLAYAEGSFRVDVTPDGSVWLSGPGDGQDLFRLGEERVFEGSPDVASFTYVASFTVAPDGSLWSLDIHWGFDGRNILSFDGERWTVRATAADRLTMTILAVGPDGTVWAVALDEDKHCPDIESGACGGTTLLRLEDDGSLTAIEDWAGVYDGDVTWPPQLAVSPDGDVWTVGGEGRVLLRFDGEGWEAIPGPEGWALGPSLAIGPDGTLWVGASRDGWTGYWEALARYDDAGWTTFTDADGVEPRDGMAMAGPTLPTVDADGSLWLDVFDDYRCHGAVHYDGTTWTSYLEEHCISDLAIAPDGSVWLGAMPHDYDTDRSSLYVITPEAVAATE